MFLLFYVGVEVSLGGWLVTFMLKVRHGKNFESGLVVTGFWLGLTFGRVILGFVTGKVGEKISIATYVVCLTAFFYVKFSFRDNQSCYARLFI